MQPSPASVAWEAAHDSPLQTVQLPSIRRLLGTRQIYLGTDWQQIATPINSTRGTSMARQYDLTAHQHSEAIQPHGTPAWRGNTTLRHTSMARQYDLTAHQHGEAIRLYGTPAWRGSTTSRHTSMARQYDLTAHQQHIITHGLAGRTDTTI